jgi:hypothetical protein
MDVLEYEELYSILANMKPNFTSVESAMQEIFEKFEIKRRSNGVANNGFNLTTLSRCKLNQCSTDVLAR